MNVTLTPTLLSGAITPPASKSQAHRVIIAAALASGTSRITGVNVSKDITATLSSMEQLGAIFQWEDETTLLISGIGDNAPETIPVMDCGESGSTLRFLIPVALSVAAGGEFQGHGRLMERPQGPYFRLFDEKGISYVQKGNRLTVKGHLTPGVYALPGDVSSQFVTGLLYALPRLAGDSEIRLTTPLQSSGYVDMTVDALSHFGVTVIPTAQGYLIPGNQQYVASDAAVEADYSQSGFFYAAAGMGNTLTVTGMNPHSRQGDRVILDFGKLLSAPGEVHLDVSECPDLVPPLAVWAALRKGQTTYIENAGRLRIKESDRLRSVTAVLSALGADIQEKPESLIITGKVSLSGGVTVDSWNDHRIAMMAAIAATVCEKPVTITGADSVSKSYPTFWEDYVRLGGQIEITP